MKVKALTSFAGPVTMFGGETRDITDEKVLNDLIKCGYVEAVEDAKASPPPAQNDNGKTNPEDDGKTNPEDDGKTEPEDDGKTEPEDDGKTEPEDDGKTEPPATPKTGKNGKSNK